MISPTLMAKRPEDVGIDSEKLEALFARAKRDVDQGVLDSCQVAVARQGKVAAMRSYGRAMQGGAEKPVTDESLFHIFSCTKAIVAAAVWLLFEDKQLRLDERVASIIPEFGTNEKDTITVEQLMLHAGGFPYAPFPAQHWNDREALLRAFSKWRLNWPVDSRFEYHATSAHWVLAEIIERRTGRPWREVVRERVLAPMGLDELYVGCPGEQQHRVADVRHMTPPVPPPGGFGEVTPEAVALLPADVRTRLEIVQQAREEQLGAVRARYAALGVKAEVEPFFKDMGARLAVTHLVIARAGASTVTELQAAGRPSILIPLAIAADDHQTANAEALTGIGAADAIAEYDFNAKALGALLAERLADPHDLAVRAAAARASAKIDATARLADLAEKLARKAH